MVYGRQYMLYGIWYMVYGIWYIIYGIWYIVYFHNFNSRKVKWRVYDPIFNFVEIKGQAMVSIVYGL